MKVLIKASLYDILRNRLLRIITIGLVIGLIAFTAIPLLLIDEYTSASSFLASGNIIIDTMFSYILIGMSVAVICSSDFDDKTANYEIMAGHKRRDVFFSKAITGILVPGALATVLTFLGLVVATLFKGWGDSLVLSDVLLRYALTIFPFMRYAAFLVMISFLFRKYVASVTVGVGAGMLGNILLVELLPNSKTNYLSICSTNLLGTYKSWSLYDVAGESIADSVSVYDSSVGSEFVLGVIGWSVLMIAVYLIVGYAYYKKDDLN